jgi:hypothetical protein
MSVLFLLVFAGPGFAKEVSLMSGFYRGQDGDDQPTKRQISVGSRFGFDIVDRSMWYVQARITSTSYSGDKAPDDSTGLLLGGGQYYFLKSFDKGIHSYLAWLGYFSNEKDSPNVGTEVETNGLFYVGSAVFRFDFTKFIIMDVEVQFFNSGLTSKTTTTTTAGGVSTETSTKKPSFMLSPLPAARTPCSSILAISFKGLWGKQTDEPARSQRMLRAS